MADPAHTAYVAEQVTKIVTYAVLAIVGLYFTVKGFRRKTKTIVVGAVLIVVVGSAIALNRCPTFTYVNGKRAFKACPYAVTYKGGTLNPEIKSGDSVQLIADKTGIMIAKHNTILSYVPRDFVTGLSYGHGGLVMLVYGEQGDAMRGSFVLLCTSREVVPALERATGRRAVLTEAN
jgi:hypothetical protein